MQALFILLVGGLVGLIQYFFGYFRHPLMASILPTLLVLFWLFLLIMGHINFTINDIIIPILGLMALLSFYDQGKKIISTTVFL